jgi:hypothetical protein
MALHADGAVLAGSRGPWYPEAVHRRRNHERGAAGIAVVVALAVLVVIVPLVLHVAHKRRAFLPFDVDAAFPPGRALVGGEAFASAAAALMRHELDSPTGWRPNDFVLWGPAVLADNNANRQRGIIVAVRESVRVLRDHLTKVSATEFDENLRAADTLLRNDETKFWFPSAESRFREAVRRLDAYVAGLEGPRRTSKPLEGRNVEAIRLFQAWTDLLGDVHANLFKETEPDGSWIPPWRTDDYFYHAQGVAHVLHHLTRAVRREYEQHWGDRKTLLRLLDEIASALGTAAHLKPFVVLDGSADGIFANHRRNLDGYIVDARQKMYSIREELEK